MKTFHKFKAISTEVDDIKFSSKKEAQYYQTLKQQVKSGEALFFLRQIPLHLPGKVKYVCDFLVFWKDGTVTFEEVKGFETPEYKIKKKIVESLYPITITQL